jgi:hypothetical protein
MHKGCPCSDPPGGEITCNVDQLAICGVIDGELVVGCFDKPANIMRLKNNTQRKNAVANWVLFRVTGVERPVDQELSPDDLWILQQGEYESSNRETRVKFSLPRDSESEVAPTAAPVVRYR